MAPVLPTVEGAFLDFAGNVLREFMENQRIRRVFEDHWNEKGGNQRTHTQGLFGAVGGLCEKTAKSENPDATFAEGCGTVVKIHLKMKGRIFIDDVTTLERIWMEKGEIYFGGVEDFFVLSQKIFHTVREMMKLLKFEQSAPLATTSTSVATATCPA
jgi:hypothetical protein